MSGTIDSATVLNDFLSKAGYIMSVFSSGSVFQEPKTAGIIGGEGKMGKFMQQLFESSGMQVHIGKQQDAPHYGDWVSEVDVVIISVPIADTVTVIKQLAKRLRPTQLISDVTSVKSPVIKAMLCSNAAVIGCHPLFAPMQDARGQNVVLCPEREMGWMGWYHNLWEKQQVNVIEMTATEHDQSMAWIQGLTHFVHLSFAKTLKTNQVDIAALLKVCSPVYRIWFAMLCRILSGDPALYAQIQTANPESVALLESFLDNGNTLLSQIRAKYNEQLCFDFIESATYLKDYVNTAKRESDYLIEQIKHLDGYQ